MIIDITAFFLEVGHVQHIYIHKAIITAISG